MKEEKLLVITSFPPKGIVHDKSVVGIASYAKNTLLGIKKYKKDVDITVLAESLDGKKENYEDDGIKVKRVWKRNSFSTFLILLNEILTSKNTKKILIEFEVAMFGDNIFLLPFPVFLLFLKLLGKKVTIVSHQVISNIEDLSGHINLNSKFKIFLLNLSIHFFYRLMLLLSSEIIVFDEVLKRKLAKFGSLGKIAVITHGVEDFKLQISKTEARKKLNLAESDFVLLYFGFLAWYKGTDLLIKYFNEINNPDKSIKLIIAGGPNPNHEGKKYYRDYIENIEENCKNSNIMLTGFVKEEDIPLYFQASDLIVLPYRTLMSASGPFSIALSFKKPFLVSDKLSEMFETEDISQLLKFEKIAKSELIFNLEKGFTEEIEALKNDKSLFAKLEEFSTKLAKLRSWDKIGAYYYEKLFTK